MAEAMSKKRTGTMTMITNNSQPYVFAASMDAGKTKLRIQAKNRLTKDTFSGEFGSDNLRRIGFYQNIKGFHNRLRMAIESKSPGDLRAYYWFYSSNHPTQRKASPSGKQDCMALILEESSKYDDDSSKWCLALKQLDIKDTVKLKEKLEDVVEVVDKRDLKLKEQMNFIVQQVKHKFDSEKLKRTELEEKVSHCENAIKKLGKICKDLNAQLNASQGKVDITNQATAQNLQEMNGQLLEKIESLTQRFELLEAQVGSDIRETHRKLDDIRPKLARLKTRKDFNNEESYIEYISKKLEEWDSKVLGPVLVRVRPDAKGKAKHFQGYVGEPVKWNSTICKVQWFGLGSKQAESLEWTALDVYLPLSAYYYPDCPHARLPQYNTMTDKIL